MKFDDLGNKMRVYETAHDHEVLPGLYMVARLDGRGFTRLTKETHDFEAPFDPRFRDMMIKTTQHLINCGFNVVYGYTQSDEISLLFHPEEKLFNRKLRKLISVLAGEGSACFSLLLGANGIFDCRISQLPNVRLVCDYFLWRQEDCHRNSLNGYCYWTLRKEGLSSRSATASLNRATIAEKNELLFQRGINFNDLPAWQKRGVGILWETFRKEGYNPKKKEQVWTERKRLAENMDLPMGLDYDAYIREILATAES